MRVILVPTAARPESELALDAAFRLAQTLQANVTGCHLRRERVEPRGTRGKQAPGAAEAADDTFTSAAARDLFSRVAAGFGFDVARRASIGKRSYALWHEMVGSPSRVLGIVGPMADLCIVSRPKAKSAGTGRAFVLAALLNSARPVLILPQRRLRTIARRIVIGWNQSVDAAATVAAAMPLLQQAESVVVLTSGSESRPGPKAAYLVQYLSQWGIRAERVRTKGRDPERELEQAYRESGADLFLMGAYSRHWFRERIFGGFTEHMLFHTDIPVLMLHR